MGLRKKYYSGFTLIEVVVVSSIIAIFSVALILNFRTSATSQTALEREASIIIAEIRKAQSLAVASARFGGAIPCGYGIHYINSDSAIIYFGSTPSNESCSDQNRNFQSPPDLNFANIRFSNNNVEFKTPFVDVFFEPPNPRVYINNDSSITASPAVITVGFKNLSCPENCRNIFVYPSGRIDAQ